MRIIAGEFRGRNILPPQGESTRPITDRVKQSLFDILAPLLPDAVVFDCFAGTGSMGLECLSRRAKHVTFFERDRSAVELLKKNIDSLGVADRTAIVSEDLFRHLAKKPSQLLSDDVDLVFLDPPYRFLTTDSAALQALSSNLELHYLDDTGTVIFRHDAKDTLELPGLFPYDQRTYGGMKLEFLRPKATNSSQFAMD